LLIMLHSQGTCDITSLLIMLHIQGTCDIISLLIMLQYSHHPWVNSY
jgi:hypothetical protein